MRGRYYNVIVPPKERGKVMKKIAVLFPGIGYHADKPLLYYSKKLVMNKGYNIVDVKYGVLPSGVKGNPEKMLEAFKLALKYATEQLQEIDFRSYDEILFISKSVGTAVAAAFADENHINARHIYFTPVPESFAYIKQPGIVFHGTADPWADTELIKTECRKRNLPLYITENANHSMETGDVVNDLLIMKGIIENVSSFL